MRTPNKTRTPKQAKLVRFNPESFLTRVGTGRSVVELHKGDALFSQGDVANAVFRVTKGKIKLTVLSSAGKEAVVAMLGEGDFFGEGALAGQHLRMATATALSDSTVIRLEKAAMVRALHEQVKFSELFMAHLLARNIRIEEDLVDQLFNSSEKRLARILLLLSRVGKEGDADTVIPKISQETLAEMIGTTRARVSHFMNKFRQLGFIEYNGGLKIHSSLLNIILYDSIPEANAGD